MVKVLVYCNQRELKIKLFQFIPLLSECNFYFLHDIKDFPEDFTAIKPHYLIVNNPLFDLLKEDPHCLKLISQDSGLIIIKQDDSKIISPADLNPVILTADFTLEELSGALVSYQPKKYWTEGDLRNENRFLQILMDNIPDTIYFKDTESRFTRINNAKAQKLNIQDPADAIGKTDRDFFDSDHAKRSFRDEQKLMKSGIPIINKLEHIKSDGENRFVTATKIPVKDKSGNIIGLVGISRDVTRNKEYEEKLLREQNLLKALMDNIPDKIFFKDRQSKFVRVNKAWADKYNLQNTDDVVGKADDDFFPKPFAQETFREEQLLMETGLPLINKLETKVREGKESYKLVTKVPIKGKNGIISGLVGISHDITDLKIAENKLAREKQLLQSLMDNSPDPIYFKDKKSKFTRINQAQASVLGLLSTADAIGKTDFDFFPVEQAELAFSQEQEILGTGRPLINYVEKITPPGKDDVWFSTTKIPIISEKGNIVGLAGVSRDITIMEMARENFRYAKEKAEESDKAKSQFLANMSHEIRTPMNGVIGMADILSYTTLTPEQQTYLDIIIKSGNNLITIINDILDLSKIEYSGLKLEKAPINVRDIMEDVADILIIAAKSKGLELSDYIDPLIPELMEGDSVRVRQILINLVNNAIKFTPKGEVFYSAELQDSTAEGFKILFKIKDSGIGIPKNVQSLLFQPFSQADNSNSRRFEGTGLGLAISKRLAEMMGGEIGVESEEGIGSLFWFTAWFGNAEQKKSAVKTHELNINDLNILIVDDNNTNRFIFSKYLQTLKCKHQLAGDPHNALNMMIEAAQNGCPFNIALLDYQMPGMDGIELAKTIKANQLIADTMLVLLSSVSDMLLPSQVTEKGFISSINKPVKLKDLYSVIASATGSKLDKILTQKNKKPQVAGNLRVLIAEDNPINARVAQIIVKPFAAVIDTVVNGQLGYEKFLAEEYDVILMDLQMPVLDGYQAAEMIRCYEKLNNRPPVKIVAMTANAMKEDVEICNNIGMDEYLTKPFRTEDMIKILENLQLLKES